MSGIKTYVQTDMRVAPTQDNHLVRLRDMIEYVNALTTEAVRAVATESIVLTGIMLPLEIDDVKIQNGERILVSGQLDKTANGIYILDGSNLVRAENFNSSTNIIHGLIVPVLEGESYGMTRWRTVLGATPFIVGTTNIEFVQEIVDLTRVVEMTFEIEGDDTEKEYDITHGLGTRHVTHELYNTEGETIVGGFKRLSVNDVRIAFGVPLGEGNDFTLVLRAEVEPA